MPMPDSALERLRAAFVSTDSAQGDGAPALRLSATGAQTFSSITLSENGAATITTDAADITAQRDGTDTQAWRLYNTFTTLNTNGEWFEATWKVTANTLLLRTNAGSSTGTVRAMVIQPATQPQAATAGAAISIITGIGVTSAAAGGALALTTGAGIGNGSGGAITITSGNSSGTSGSVSGAITIKTGLTSALNNGAAMTFQTQGGISVNGGTPGSNAGTFVFSGGAGTASTAATGVGGVGSTFAATMGNGGTASGATSSTGGLGGGITWTAGDGGAITGTTAAIGGAGGAINITAGNGATATTGSSNTAGVGGTITFTAGNAGAAGGNVNGGNIVLTPGTATGSGTAGTVSVTRGALKLSNAIGSLATSADEVRLGAFDLSAGNATLSISTETAVAVDIGLASTSSLTVRINGTNYKIPLVTA